MSNKNSIISSLTQIGIGENEAILYEILLKNPKASIPTLQKDSPFSRTMLYYILENLKKLKLITTKKEGKKKIYDAIHPNRLLEILTEKEQETKRQKTQLDQMFPDLVSYYRLGHNKPGIRFLEGKRGIKIAAEETMKSTNKFYASIIDIEAIHVHVPRINDESFKRKKRLDVSSQTLVVDTPYARRWYNNLGPDDHKSNIRFLPKGVEKTSTIVQMYDNRVTYYSFSNEHKIAVIIEDPGIHDLHYSLFKYLWNEAKKSEDKKKV